MKHNLYNPNKLILLFVFLTLILSCNKQQSMNVDDLIEEGDLAKIKKAKDKLKAQSDSINQLVQKLELSIVKNDTLAGKYALVELYQAKDTLYEHYIQIQASVQTNQDAQISPEFSGVIRLNVREGQYVGKGAIIGTISDGGLREQLTQAQIQVDQARSQVQQAQIQSDLAKITYQKQSNLWKQKIGSEIQYLQAKTNYDTSLKQVQVAKQQVSAAQKGVASIQAQLRKTNLVAPFGGVVEEVITKSGQVVAPGVPVVRLVNASNLKLVAEVPENYLSKIKVGTKAIVSLPAVNETIPTKVSLVRATINPNNRTFSVEIPLNNQSGKIKPNLNAQIKLNDYTNPNSIVVPESVVQEDTEGSYVFIAHKNNNQTIAKKVHITTGVESNGLVEITQGLNHGDWIVSDGAERLQEGDAIKTLN